MPSASARPQSVRGSGYPKYLLLRVYGDHAVVAGFDRQRRVLLSDYRVLPLADTTVSYRLERVGPLQRVPQR
jgi:hypothetical protein